MPNRPGIPEKQDPEGLQQRLHDLWRDMPETTAATTEKANPYKFIGRVVLHTNTAVQALKAAIAKDSSSWLIAANKRLVVPLTKPAVIGGNWEQVLSKVARQSSNVPTKMPASIGPATYAPCGKRGDFFVVSLPILDSAREQIAQQREELATLDPTNSLADTEPAVTVMTTRSEQTATFIIDALDAFVQANPNNGILELGPPWPLPGTRMLATALTTPVVS